MNHKTYVTAYVTYDSPCMYGH